MSEFRVENSEMSSAEFVQSALQASIAPPQLGSVKARIRHASRPLGWSASRTKDAWYADPRIALRADEIRDVEQKTGLRYGREEIKTVDELIARADALLVGENADFYRSIFAALRSVARGSDSTRTGSTGLSRIVVHQPMYGRRKTDFKGE